MMTTFGSGEIMVLNSFNEGEIISPLLGENNLHMIFLAIYSTEQEPHKKSATNNYFCGLQLLYSAESNKPQYFRNL